MNKAIPHPLAQNAVQKLLDVQSQKGWIEMGAISDGHHTFDELYEHRITLYIELCKWIKTLTVWYHEVSEFIEVKKHIVWKSELHSDGTSFPGWFILGIEMEDGRQISYHLPMSYWQECEFAKTLEVGLPWDGHTAADVLRRLKEL